MITIFRPHSATRALLLAGGACLTFTSVATAQSGDQAVAADSIMLEEVLVTARKREESLQDVPMSITAFSADAIEQRGIESIYDVARLTPNLSFNQAYGRAFDRPVIRGMSQILGERTVSFVIDGIYIAGNVSGTDIDDIESIEVLKGPQAANFGRGSLAGVISYRTRKPSADWRGEASASLGEHGYQEFTGNVSGPIVGETLTFKLGARFYDYDGQYRAVSSDGSTPTIGGERTERVSGALRWQPTESFDFTLRAFAAQNNDDLYNNIISTTLNCFQTQGGAAARGGSYCGRIPVIPQEGGIFIDKSDIVRQGDPGVTSDTFLYSGEANWDIGPVTATALISWNRQDEDWIVDDYIINRVVVGASGPSQAASPTMTIQNPGNITRLIQIREYRSQELRFASNKEGRWQWLAGVYHYDQLNTGFNGGPRYNVNLANGMASPTNTGPTGTLREVSQPSSPFEVENTAVFAAVNFDPTDRWHLSLEGRYAQDELATNNTVQAGGNCAPRLEAEFSSFTPRASVRFDLSEDANVYFSVAQGNKPGDFNNSLCGALVPPDEFARLSTIAPLGIDEEQSLNYELGTKWRLLGGRMSFDAAVFYTDWEDQQVTGSQVYRQTTGTISNISLSTNAGSTEVYGLELSWRFRPNENWDFDLGYGYVNAEFKELCDNVYATLLGTTVSPITSTGPCPSAGTTRFESVAGFQTANSPEHSLSAGAQVSVPLNERWSFFARTDASFQSERFAEVYNHASTGDSLRFDARLGVEGDSWKVTAWGRNIGNERSADSIIRFFNPDSPAFARAYQVHYPDGRQLGVTAEYRF